MAAKLHDEGKNRVLNILFGATAVDGVLYLGLYKNVSEPDETKVLIDLDEPSGFGYTRKALTRGQWTITDDVAQYVEQTFLASGGGWGDVTGYFLATSLDNAGKLVASEHFTTALTVADGKGIKITPKITGK